MWSKWFSHEKRIHTHRVDYAELRKVREELRELAIHKVNYEELRDIEEREQ